MSQFKQSVFVSLPVSDLSKSIVFYKSIGLTQKMEFPNNEGAWMELSDTFSVMLITHSKWKEFTPRAIPDARKTAQFGLSITTESKETVTNMIEKGTKAGGKADPNPVEEFDFMFGRSLEDPDGHILEFKWMDMSAMPASN
ncbi:MAG: hypothetical protein A4S09_17040 [Proteobacteria bacterium SG_bin7]|nr:MAG: hypothetical protein A4S09_17040 [Proteobacteria bacterium SG_bin7]